MRKESPTRGALPRFTDEQIIAGRPERENVHARQPYAFLVEPERNANGEVVKVATVFLTNRECPFRCLMCDLWKYMLTESVEPGDIPHQIDLALAGLPPLGEINEIKLYNGGSFFDRKAIPPEDYTAIADQVRRFETVIVENHPKLCTDACLRFRDLIAPAQLEIAIGLETCHPEVLASLNKSMDLSDYDRAVSFLHNEGIRTRAFLLHQPPFLDECDATQWTLRSIEYAFERGVDCCAVIPTRAGNGIMDQLAKRGDFTPPKSESLEEVMERGLALRGGRVLVDLWDAEELFSCGSCRDQRIDRLQQMNLSQQLLPAISCDSCRDDVSQSTAARRGQ